MFSGLCFELVYVLQSTLMVWNPKRSSTTRCTRTFRTTCSIVYRYYDLDLFTQCYGVKYRTVTNLCSFCFPFQHEVSFTPVQTVNTCNDPFLMTCNFVFLFFVNRSHVKLSLSFFYFLNTESVCLVFFFINWLLKSLSCCSSVKPLICLNWTIWPLVSFCQ